MDLNKKTEIGSGAIKEYVHPLLIGHPLRVVFVVIGETEKSVVISVINNGLSISLKKSVGIRPSGIL